MENNLIKKIGLDNGLELELCDASKKVAGDRWLVKLTVKIDIPVKDYLADLPPDMEANDVMQVLGEKVVFEKTIERNFVDDKEKETILDGFLNSFIDNSVPYLSGSNFPNQFIVKKYKETKVRTSWHQK